MRYIKVGLPNKSTIRTMLGYYASSANPPVEFSAYSQEIDDECDFMQNNRISIADIVNIVTALQIYCPGKPADANALHNATVKICDSRVNANADYTI